MSLMTWIIIMLLILVNALYVAAEFSAVTVRRSRIQQLADDGHGLASKLLPVLEDPVRLDRYVAACQIGITISSLVLGAYAQATLAADLVPLFERLGSLQHTAAASTSALVVLVSMTVLQVVLGELVPKSLALQFPTQVSLYTTLPMKWSLQLLSPVTAVMNGSGNLLLKAMGISNAGHKHVHSAEEIGMLLRESKQGGLLDAEEHHRLAQALRLDSRPVRELMVPAAEVEVVDVEAHIGSILDQVTGSAYTRLPAYRGAPDNIIGFLHTKDLITFVTDPRKDTSVRELIQPILTIPEEMTAEELLSALRLRHAHMAIVVNSLGRVTGLITLEDILADILGEAGDEFKEAVPEPELLPNGLLRIPGGMPIQDLDSWLELPRDGSGFTVGEYVTSLVGRVPLPGESVSLSGLLCSVEQVENGQIIAIVVDTQQRAEEEKWIS